jgi:hypothetical protein
MSEDVRGRAADVCGPGVASSNLASPTKPMDAIRPSRNGVQPTFLLPSIEASFRHRVRRDPPVSAARGRQ